MSTLDGPIWSRCSIALTCPTRSHFQRTKSRKRWGQGWDERYHSSREEEEEGDEDGQEKGRRKAKENETEKKEEKEKERGGAVPDPVWVGSKWLLDFSRVPVTQGTPLPLRNCAK